MQARSDGEELGLSMYLQQGDVQLVSNHFVLHARTEFTDYTEAEIAQASATAAAEAGDAARGKRRANDLYIVQVAQRLPLLVKAWCWVSRYRFCACCVSLLTL
jgi:hypothetical protein